MASLLEIIPDSSQTEAHPEVPLSPRDLLIQAIKRKALETMKRLLAGSHVNSAVKFESFPLNLACQYGFLEGVQWLHREAGALIYQADGYGDLPTHLAALG